MNTARALNQFEAMLFDLDGVLTPTATIHAACWKRVFDEFLKSRADSTGEPFVPFDLPKDYLSYVDGKPRYPGVQSFLASRNIELPYGDPKDSPNQTTVCGIGNGKDSYFSTVLREDGIAAFPGAVALVKHLRNQGIKTAVVSSSRNCKPVLTAAGITHLFDTIMDGRVAETLHLPGKPAPDTFLRAAADLAVSPEKAVVFEDAIAGVQAGQQGKFGLVIGVAEPENAQALLDNGANTVVADLGELLPTE